MIIQCWHVIGYFNATNIIPMIFQKKCKFRYANIGTLLDNNKLLLVNLITPIPVMEDHWNS